MTLVLFMILAALIALFHRGDGGPGDRSAPAAGRPKAASETRARATEPRCDSCAG